MSKSVEIMSALETHCGATEVGRLTLVACPTRHRAYASEEHLIRGWWRPSGRRSEHRGDEPADRTQRWLDSLARGDK
jgi:hypothetical protein